MSILARILPTTKAMMMMAELIEKELLLLLDLTPKPITEKEFVARTERASPSPNTLAKATILKTLQIMTLLFSLIGMREEKRREAKVARRLCRKMGNNLETRPAVTLELV